MKKMQLLVLASVSLVVAVGAQDASDDADARRQAIVDAQLAGDFTPDLARGRVLYAVSCARCHVFGSLGSAFGPDLTTMGSRFQARDALEAILWPSRVVSDQYEAERIEMADGTVLNGIVVRETPTAIQVRVGAVNTPLVVTTNGVVAREPSRVSAMPAGLVEGMPPDDLASLLAFVLGPAPE